MIMLMNNDGEILIDTKEIKHNLGEFEKVKEEIRKRGLKICGDAYEADVSLFSPGMKAGYVTEISIMVEKVKSND